MLKNSHDLRTVPSFRHGLTLPDWRRITDLPVAVHVKAGFPLFDKTQSSRSVAILQSGHVKLTYSNQLKRVAIGVRSAGWVNGGCYAFVDDWLDFVPIALTDCIASIYGPATFISELNRDTNLRSLVDVVLAAEAQALLMRQLQLRTRSAADRLDDLLEELTRLPRSSGTDSGIVKQTLMAQLLAITPEHLCRMMGRIRRPRHRLDAAPKGIYVLPAP